VALHVETARSVHLSEAARDRIAATLRLAEQLGGEAITGRADEAEEIVRIAGVHNVTHIIDREAEAAALARIFARLGDQPLIRRPATSAFTSLPVTTRKARPSHGREDGPASAQFDPALSLATPMSAVRLALAFCSTSRLTCATSRWSS
jgi:two-component system sensor histidine kinase KdpD